MAANDVWAVGHYFNYGILRGETLVEHWDGIAWSVVPSPTSPNNYGPRLHAVAAVSASDVWAVGGLSVYEHQREILVVLYYSTTCP